MVAAWSPYCVTGASMPSRASANTSCLITIGVGRGIVRTIRKTFEKICKYWFKVVTVWRLIWGNDHLYCGFGAWRSHLTLHWMSAKGSVGFRWGTITGPYHANFSQVETQKFDPHWFYCLQWGCNNLFLPRVYLFMLGLKLVCVNKNMYLIDKLTIHDNKVLPISWCFASMEYIFGSRSPFLVTTSNVRCVWFSHFHNIYRATLLGVSTD